MKKSHKDVEFDVYPLDDGGWEWIVYPIRGEGARFANVEDNEEKATAAARAAIDRWLTSKRKAGKRSSD
jgi:hypothetical protein